jgi:amidase
MTSKIILIMALILGIGGCRNQKEIDPPDLSELTIGDIHEAYKEGRFTAEQLTVAYLSRIDGFDEQINSITTINSEAISIARQLDAEYQKTGKLRALHGIPIVVKDNINTRGMPTTAGAFALKDFIPDKDAPIIQRLVDAGAIVLAKSNMAEWAFSPMHTESSTYGTTRNPYNLEYVPAGSSSGTAAAIASNFGAVGLGTDTGNSIRGPSSHCALVGFRTTLGLISRSGIVPLFLRNDVVGPMCRTVEDATRVMEVMAGMDPEVKALFEQAMLDLKSLGAEIIDPLVIPGFSSLRQNQWCATFRKDVESYLETHVKNDTIKTLEDVIRAGSESRFSKDRLTDYVSRTGRWGYPEEACGDAYHDPKRIAFREAIESVMDSLNIDAIVYPSWNHKPARIAFFEQEYRGDNSQVISPHTGQPAFTVPMGYTSGHLPAGLQFLGRMFDEPTLIRLAYAFEQGTQHRKPPLLD